MTEAAKRCVEALRDNINNGFLLVGGFNGSVHASEIIHLIESMSAQLEAAQPKWISVKAGLPKAYRNVDIVFGSHDSIGYYSPISKRWYDSRNVPIDGVSYWKYRDEPPKEDVYGKNNA